MKEAKGAKVVSPPILGEREIVEGKALGLSIFSILAIELYNHPVRSGLSLREFGNLQVVAQLVSEEERGRMEETESR